jgi:hypothetical protein
MASKSEKIQEAKKGRIKVDKLQNRGAVKDLSDSAAKEVKGGRLRRKIAALDPYSIDTEEK